MFRIRGSTFPTFNRITDKIEGMWFNDSNEYLYYYSLDIPYTSGAPDETPPTITFSNETTTNDTILLKLNGDENFNLSMIISTTGYTSGSVLSNSSFGDPVYWHNTTLVNNTPYYFNASVWDSTGNYGTYNFSVMTAQTPAAADTCTCPDATNDFVISGGDNCIISSGCDNYPYAFRIDDGTMTIKSGAYIRAKGCFYPYNSMHIEQGGGIFCGQ
jgi:hypothetical protein